MLGENSNQRETENLITVPLLNTDILKLIEVKTYCIATLIM